MNNKKLYDEYFLELRKRVEQAGLLKQTPLYCGTAMVLSIIFYIIGLLLIGKVPLLISIVHIYIALVLFAFMSHDLAHNQYFRNKKLNTFFAYLTGSVFFGMGYHWWAHKHNLKHHTFTNSDTQDDDIREADHIFIQEKGKYPFFQKHKAILYWFTVPFMYIHLLVMSFSFSIKNKKYVDIATSLSALCILLGSFVIHFGWPVALISIITIYLLVGVHLAFAFMINHIGMKVIDGTKFSDYSWFDVQVRTSRNIRGGRCVHLLLGGLNKQIEHHIFPKVSRNQIYKIAKVVKSFCKEKGISYHEVGFFEAIGEIQTTLRSGKTR